VRTATNAVRNAIAQKATHAKDIAIELPADPDDYIAGLMDKHLDLGDLLDTTDENIASFSERRMVGNVLMLQELHKSIEDSDEDLHLILSHRQPPNRRQPSRKSNASSRQR
jgi:hypothetical protein